MDIGGAGVGARAEVVGVCSAGVVGRTVDGAAEVDARVVEVDAGTGLVVRCAPGVGARDDVVGGEVVAFATVVGARAGVCTGVVDTCRTGVGAGPVGGLDGAGDGW